MSSKTKREERRKKNQRQKTTNTLIWSAIGVAVLAVVGFVVWQGVKPAAGQSFPIMVSSPHIDTDTDPGTYNSDPPTSGPHYAEEARAGFHDTNSYKYPAGYLVHNLEHGYIIFWYNCAILDDSTCAQLKTQLRTVIDDVGEVKVIAYPWPSLDVPVVATSWGRMQKFESFDVNQAKAFYQANLNKAPEPDAP
jgi:flagellar basal body-associated protein FliL